jgi:hypothetical protein
VDYQEAEDALLIGADAVAGDPAYAECARDAGRNASCCRSLTVTVTYLKPDLNHIDRFRYDSGLPQTEFFMSMRAVYCLLAAEASHRHGDRRSRGSVFQHADGEFCR